MVVQSSRRANSLLLNWSWCELCGGSETVEGERVAQVVGQVLDWALACDNGLDEESKHGEHSLHAAHLVSHTLIWLMACC